MSCNDIQETTLTYFDRLSASGTLMAARRDIIIAGLTDFSVLQIIRTVEGSLSLAISFLASEATVLATFVSPPADMPINSPRSPPMPAVEAQTPPQAA